jgi:hypothetical protein
MQITSYQVTLVPIYRVDIPSAFILSLLSLNLDLSAGEPAALLIRLYIVMIHENAVSPLGALDYRYAITI